MSLTLSKRQILWAGVMLTAVQLITIPQASFGQPQQQYVVNGMPVPDNVGKAWMLLKSASSFQVSSPEKSLALLSEAEQLAPDVPEIQSDLGMMLGKLGRTDDGILHLEKALKLNPNLIEAEVTLGSLYQSVGRTQEAIRVFKEFQTRHPASEYSAKVKGLITMLESESKLQSGKSGATGSSGDDYFESIALSSSVTKWAADKMPLKVFFEPTQGVAGYKPGYMDGVKSAFQEWADSSNGKVSFVFVADKAKSDITFSFSNDIKAVSNPAEGGEAKIYPGEKGIERAQVVVLTMDPSPGQPMTEGLMHWICLHEIGHVLGFMGHSSQHSDVMYYSMPLSFKERGLSERDKNTVKHLYSDAVQVPAADPKAIATDTNDPLKLNNEGTVALQAKNLELGIERFEKALKLQPGLKVVKQNLAQAYSIKAMQTAQAGKIPDADAWFKKAVALLDGGTTSPADQMVLKTYVMFLRLANRVPEATKIEATLKRPVTK